MRHGIRKEIDWEYVGAQLANEGDIQQIAFIRGFLNECKTWGTHFQIEQQLADINHGLTQEEREMLKMLSYTGEGK